jgi:hypothetical protein
MCSLIQAVPSLWGVQVDVQGKVLIPEVGSVEKQQSGVATLDIGMEMECSRKVKVSNESTDSSLFYEEMLLFIDRAPGL